jgi:hypothetical protein
MENFFLYHTLLKVHFLECNYVGLLIWSRETTEVTGMLYKAWMNLHAIVLPLLPSFGVLRHTLLYHLGLVQSARLWGR